MRRRTPEQRRRDRVAGVDRFGRPLARAAGTNPRALAAAQPLEPRSATGTGRVARRLLAEFVRQERISCFRCGRYQVAWAAGGWREPQERDGNPCWVICVPCVRRRKEVHGKELRKAA